MTRLRATIIDTGRRPLEKYCSRKQRRTGVCLVGWRSRLELPGRHLNGGRRQ